MEIIIMNHPQENLIIIMVWNLMGDEHQEQPILVLLSGSEPFCSTGGGNEMGILDALQASMSR